MFDKFLNEKCIDTDADSIIKGIELQKLRAVVRLLDGLINQKTIMCTIEYVDDVFQLDISDSIPIYTTEQNKSYSSSFSINSHEIKNSLRIFLDTWLGIVDTSEKIEFVFYTNTSISKEKRVGKLLEFDDLPETPILQLLVDKKIKEAMPYVKAVLSDYYVEQYKRQKHITDSTPYEKIINKVTDEQWMKFLGQIEWDFNEPDEIELRKNILDKITLLCERFGIEDKFSEKICAEILDMINMKTFDKDFLERVVHVGEVKSIFLEKALDVKTREFIDPLYVMWDEVEKSGMRNITEKINSVCPDYDSVEMEYIIDDCTDGLYEQKQHYDVRAVKAYKYRIYNICKRLMHKKSKNYTGAYSEDEVNTIIEELVLEATKVIEDKGKTYNIAFKDDEMIRKTILILFDECYLAFD